MAIKMTNVTFSGPGAGVVQPSLRLVTLKRTGAIGMEIVDDYAVVTLENYARSENLVGANRVVEIRLTDGITQNELAANYPRVLADLQATGGRIVEA